MPVNDASRMDLADLAPPKLESEDDEEKAMLVSKYCGPSVSCNHDRFFFGLKNMQVSRLLEDA